VVVMLFIPVGVEAALHRYIPRPRSEMTNQWDGIRSRRQHLEVVTVNFLGQAMSTNARSTIATE
jgi:hypothetical protein